MSVQRFLLAIGLVLVTSLSYFNAFNHPFVHDDVVFIEQNTHIDRLDLKEIFVSPPSPTGEGVNTYYRPFLELIYRLEYQAFGFDAQAFHAVNIVWHAVNAVLVFVLCLQLGLSTFFAWGIALFFALHPVQSEAVACVAGVSNIAVTFWILLAWIAYIRRWFVPSIVAFIIALLAKETALVFLPLMMLTDWLLGRKQWGNWLIVTVITLLFLTWRHALTQSNAFADIMANPIELSLRLLHIPTALLSYVKSTVWPGDLHYYRNLDILRPWWPSWATLGCLMVGIKFLSPSDSTERRLFWFGLGVFVTCLLPVLGIAPLINEYALILTADHFVYLPLVGLLISLGCLVRQWLLPPRRVVVMTITVLLMAMLTIYQNTFWESEVALFERVVQFEPAFGRGQALLAKAYFNHQRYKKALEHYAHAQTIFENYAIKSQDLKAQHFYTGFLKNIHVDQAQTYLALGQYKEAATAYIQAINLVPADSQLYNNLATVMMTQHQWDEARRMLQHAYVLDPGNLMVRNNMGVCFINQGYPSIARTIWQQILVVNPTFLPAIQNLEKIKK